MGFEHYEQKGGVRPERKWHYLSFNTQTGKTLSLSDFVTAKQYSQIVAKKLAHDYPQAAELLMAKPLKMTNNFYVEPDGIAVTYQPGELLPPQAGELTTKILFSELR